MDRDCELDLIIYVLSLFDGVYFAVDGKWISSIILWEYMDILLSGQPRILNLFPTVRLFQVYTFISVPQHFTSHIWQGCKKIRSNIAFIASLNALNYQLRKLVTLLFYEFQVPHKFPQLETDPISCLEPCKILSTCKNDLIVREKIISHLPEAASVLWVTFSAIPWLSQSRCNLAYLKPQD